MMIERKYFMYDTEISYAPSLQQVPASYYLFSPVIIFPVKHLVVESSQSNLASVVPQGTQYRDIATPYQTLLPYQ